MCLSDPCLRALPSTCVSMCVSVWFHMCACPCSRTFGSSGLAISRDGSRLATADWTTKKVSVYRTPGLELEAVLGCGSVTFENPHALTFTAAGTLLVAENRQMRVQEVSVSGQHVRYVGVGAIKDFVGAVATDDVIIVVGKSEPYHDDAGIMVFDACNGSLLRSFGSFGPGDGCVYYCHSIKFSPDASQMCMCFNGHLAWFTRDGEFVRSIAMQSCLDSEYTASGEVMVLRADGEVHVLAAGGEEVVRRWGGYGSGRGQFEHPNRLAVWRHYVYVLSYNRIQVFT